MKKRVLSLLLVMLMVVSLVPTGMIQANAESFQSRLSMTPENAPAYYTTLNPYYTSGYGMPNCTCYAYGRAYEILGKKPNLSLGNAQEWWDYNKRNNYYPSGKTPALGAIACWKSASGTIGHVAVVEAINGDTVTTSESGWNYKYFWTTKRSASSSNFSSSEGYTFQGFIYILGNGSSGGQTPSISVKERIAHKYNITVPANYLLKNYTSELDMNANSKNNVEKQSSSYTIRSTERVILSNGTVRYKWKSGDTPPKTLWFNYDSSAMSVTAMHDYSDSVVKEPTCTEQGYTTYCCNCGEMYVGNYVPAKGHTPMAVDSGTEATCTEPGYTAFIMCEVCFSTLYDSPTRIPPKGHEYKYGKCTRCGEADPDYIPPAPTNFDDVSQNSYCYDAVQWAVEHEVTKGVSANKFAPNNGCTRAQVVTLMWRAAGAPNFMAKIDFDDVDNDAYYYDGVKWAVSYGISKGTSERTFSPDDLCTRGQVVTFLWRAAGEPIVDETINFVDVSPNSYCYNAVQWAVAKGITKGTDATHFSPSATCTRGQVVTFLYRAE